MKTVRDRIEWIVNNGINPDTGEVWREDKALSLASGLAEAHINKIVNGEIGEPREVTRRKIASAARVSYLWLSEGVGGPYDLDSTIAPGSNATLPAELTAPPENTSLDVKELVRKAKKVARRDGFEIEDYAWEEFERIAPRLRGEVTTAAAIELADSFSKHGIGKPRTPSVIAKVETGPHRAAPPKGA